MRREAALVAGVLLVVFLAGCGETEEGGGGLAFLPAFKDFTAHRASSFDRSGGNDDGNWGHPIQAGETRTLAELQGPGMIHHIWFTIASGEE